MFDDTNFLQETALLNYSRNGRNYCIHAFEGHKYPAIMEEVGKLRVYTYKDIGASSNESSDLDEKDIKKIHCYQQIIVRHNQSIVAGCRVYSPLFYLSFNNESNLGTILDDDKTNKLNETQCNPKNFATEQYFSFGDEFLKNYISKSMDIGRMFILPHLQGGYKYRREGSFLLDAIFHGLATIIKKHNVHYLMGRVILSPRLNKDARRAVIAFLHLHHSCYHIIEAKKTSFTLLEIKEELEVMERGGAEHTGFAAEHPNYVSNYKIMQKTCQQKGAEVPALIKAYLSLSPSLKFFGGVRDEDLSSTEELGIMVNIKDIYPKFRSRYL